MACPVCGQRKPRRACPALSQTICPVCCGTKRLVEIDCPPDCVHLAAAREHPAAVIKRQQERDLATLLPSIAPLTERQHQLFFVFQTAIARHEPEAFVRLTDDDVAEAAGTVAKTLETAARGVIYEHSTQSVVAQRLANDLRGVLEEMRGHGARVYDGEVAIVLRAIEQGARDARKASNEGPATYLALMGRLLHGARTARTAAQADAAAPRAPSPIVIP